MRALVIAVAVSALVFVPGAAAHGDGAARGFTSTVTGIEPAADGLGVAILDSDDRLQVTNGTGETVIVLGYGQEPYVKFEDGAVYVNKNSGTHYLNQDRYGAKKPPADIDLSAPPDWEQVADGDTYDWHDHRIHWMSATDPEVVRNDRQSAHHILDWTVPVEVGSQAVKVNGRLDYAPPDESRSVWLYGGIGLLVIAGVAGAVFLRRRNRSPRPA